MGVKPPTDGVEEEPDVIEFGIPAVAARLETRDVSYPVDAEALADAHGDLDVPVDAAGHEIELARAIEKTDRDGFDSERDLLDALHPVFEAERAAVSRSILAQLRGLLPF